MKCKENINPNIEYFSTPPFGVTSDEEMYLYNIHVPQGTGRLHTTYYLTDISNIGQMIDLNEFAYETSMADIVEFRQALTETNEMYGTALRREDNNYIFDVTKKYAWKPGIYDAMKLYINIANQFHKRPSGINSIFNRMECSNWNIRRFKSQMQRLDNFRNKAKRASGNLVNNMDELMDIQTNVLSNIHNSTKIANQMSDYFDIYNYIDSNAVNMDSTEIGLYTVVIAHSKSMSIIKTDGDEICKIEVPKACLLFKRKLYKVLAGGFDYHPWLQATTINNYHPYINNTPIWNHVTNDSVLSSNPWGALCLSAFADDIVRPLGRNDYQSFVSGLMSWNSIYNIEATNPYHNPAKISYHAGFVEKEDKEKAEGIKTWFGFRPQSCFTHQSFLHISTELNDSQHTINRQIYGDNIAPYANYIINSCDKKECIFRDNCLDYKRIKALFDWKDYQEIIESYIGFVFEGSTKEDYSLEYQQATSKLMQMSIRDIISYLAYNLSNANYWRTEPLTPEEEMQENLMNWLSDAEGNINGENERTF